MKKVLFATTALVASAGVAAADDNLNISIGGSAEMGIVGGSDQETQFHNDVDISFGLAAETGTGLSFGAVVDLDEAGNLGRALDNQGTSVFISGDFGTLTLGDTDGAVDFVMPDASTAGNPGSIDDSEPVHGGYLGAYLDGLTVDLNADGDSLDAGEYNGDNQVLRYNISFGDFTVAVSHEQEADDATGVVAATSGDGSTAIGVQYSGSFGAADVTAGLGYMVIDTDGTTPGSQVEHLGVSVLVELASGFSAVVGYSDIQDLNLATGVAVGAEDDHTFVGVGYSTGAISVHANYGEFDSGGEGYGLAASYDLGGGASVHAAYGDTDGGASTWSLGVAMGF